MISILPEHRYDEWDAFVESHPSGSIYHTSDWIKVIKSAYKILPLIFCEFNNSSISAGIPVFLHKNVFRGKRLISITSAQSCNPLINSAEQLNALINYIKYFIKKENIDYVQVRVTEDFYFDTENLSKQEKIFFTYLIELNVPYEEISKKFHKSCIIRPLKKAEENNLKLIEQSDSFHLNSFYRNYEQMRKDNGTLPQPFSFFFHLVNTFAKKNMLDIFHIQSSDRIISTVINLKYKDRYIYEYGATDKHYLKLHPSHYLIDYSIKRAISDGFKIFDFGRTDTTNIGLDNFKRRWGGKKTYFTYYTIANDKKQFNANNLQFSHLTKDIISHTPQKIYHLIGSILYKKLF